MQVTFSQDKTKIIFLHENGHEYKFLHNYPAFLKSGMYYYIPAKSHILHNLIARLKKANQKLKLTQEVLTFLEEPFKLKEIPSSFKYHTEPMDYQAIALRYLYTVGSGGLLLDPGMGKSKVVLDYIALMGFEKVIIICPKALLFVWEDEIAIHRPELSYYTVRTTDWDAEYPGIKGARVTIINYTKSVAFKPQLKRMGYNFIHLDEFLIKDPKTERTQSLTDIAYGIDYKCGGSGTLINNTVMDVFCPVRYLEPALVGQNYKKFFDRHVVTVMANKGLPNQRSQVVGYKGADVARSILESCSIVMTKDKWLKLPKKNFHDVLVQMTPVQKDTYYSLMRNYIVNVGSEIVEVDNPLVMMSKLYQISNGFVYITPPGEEGEEVAELVGEDPKKKRKKTKRKTVFLENPAKVEALRTLLTETCKGKRAIIWFNMSAEFELIRGLLEELGHSYLSIRGGEGKLGEKVREFNHNPSIQWLVCQAKSVNYGITVLGTSLEKLEDSDYEIFPGIAPEVHTEIFYSLNFSLEVYLQQQDRIHRLGQKHECDYYRLFSNSPVEKRIREAIEDKMSLRLEMLVDIAEKLKTEVQEEGTSLV